MKVPIVVWVCPASGCGHYYGSKHAGGLSSAINRRTSMQNRAEEDPSAWGQVLGTHDECPDCRDRGVRIRRVPVSIEVEVPEAAAPVGASG